MNSCYFSVVFAYVMVFHEDQSIIVEPFRFDKEHLQVSALPFPRILLFLSNLCSSVIFSTKCIILYSTIYLPPKEMGVFLQVMIKFFGVILLRTTKFLTSAIIVLALASCAFGADAGGPAVFERVEFSIIDQDSKPNLSCLRVHSPKQSIKNT